MSIAAPTLPRRLRVPRTRFIMSITRPVIMKESHTSETEMGTVYSAFLLTYALFMGPGGALAVSFRG